MFYWYVISLTDLEFVFEDEPTSPLHHELLIFLMITVKSLASACEGLVLPYFLGFFFLCYSLYLEFNSIMET